MWHFFYLIGHSALCYYISSWHQALHISQFFADILIGAPLSIILQGKLSPASDHVSDSLFGLDPIPVPLYCGYCCDCSNFVQLQHVVQDINPIITLMPPLNLLRLSTNFGQRNLICYETIEILLPCPLANGALQSRLADALNVFLHLFPLSH